MLPHSCELTQSVHRLSLSMSIMSRKRMHPFPDQTKTPRPTFDMFMVEDCFPRVRPVSDLETRLMAGIMKRNTDLTPTLEEQTHIAALVSQVQIALDTISLDPVACAAFQVDEFRIVGSYKKGTMIRGRNEADIVVIMHSQPTSDMVTKLSDRVSEELLKTSPGHSFDINLTDYGFSVSDSAVNSSVRMLLTTQISNMRRMDGRQFIPTNLLHKHMSAIRHVRWFEDSASGGAFKVLIRVMKDIVQRYPGLQVLNKWTIDVLSHYSIAFLRTEATLPLNHALKRVFQLLAAGLFLPGSAGIPDPCESGAVSLHSSMTQKQQDRLCMTAQTIVRILSTTSGFETILGLVPDGTGVLERESEWDGFTLRLHTPVIGGLDPECKQTPADTSETMETTDADVKDQQQKDNPHSITLFINDPQEESGNAEQ